MIRVVVEAVRIRFFPIIFLSCGGNGFHGSKLIDADEQFSFSPKLFRILILGVFHFHDDNVLYHTYKYIPYIIPSGREPVHTCVPGVRRIV